MQKIIDADHAIIGFPYKVHGKIYICELSVPVEYDVVRMTISTADMTEGKDTFLKGAFEVYGKEDTVNELGLPVKIFQMKPHGQTSIE